MDELFIIQTSELAKEEKSFHIDMYIDIPKMRLGNNEALTLIPVLINGDKQKELPYILINGKTRHKGYKQMVHHVGEAMMRSSYKIYKAFKSRRFCNRVCYYNIRIVYEDWMGNAKIQLKGIERIPTGEVYVA
ncbi:MAG: DUF3868 domain-containing protein [Dysgonomonas sp.]|jgi:hypothetical protein|nr:DUF3868 domain-containing protein [Prevotella sp.]